MLTLFALPKLFRGHFNIIQRNAIQSWLRLRPACEVILLGDEDGTAQVARELGARHLAGIKRNEFGTPLVNLAFEKAERAASYPHLCYVNADIILMSDFLPAVGRVLREKPWSLSVGRRWDLDVKEPLDFADHWESQLRDCLDRQGRLHAHTGIDYFVYPKGFWDEIPPFALGRSSWDSWLLYRAQSCNIAVIDLTLMVRVVHQNHDYSHHPRQWEGVWKGPEADRNLELAGGIRHAYTLLDTQYQLTPKGIRTRISPYYFYRLLVTASSSHPLLEKLLKLVRWMRGRFVPQL